MKVVEQGEELEQIVAVVVMYFCLFYVNFIRLLNYELTLLNETYGDG